MSRIQPGSGYGFTSGGYGFTLNTEDPFAAFNQGELGRHPFKIYNVQIVTSGGSTYVTFQVQSGTINNLVPLLYDLSTASGIKLDRTTAGVPNPPTCQLYSGNFDATTKTSYIELRAGASLSTSDYPDPVVTSNQYPIIDGGNTAPATPDDDTYGYLVIGTITVDSISAPTTFTVSQNVSGSLWGDRIKLGTDTAQYYYARI